MLKIDIVALVLTLWMLQQTSVIEVPCVAAYIPASARTSASSALAASAVALEQDIALQQSSTLWLVDETGATVRNAAREIACQTLLYEQRRRFCMAVLDDSLLASLHGTAAPGNYWTPRTTLISFPTTSLNGQDVSNFYHERLMEEWEGTQCMQMPSLDNDDDDANLAASKGVRMLRSLPTKVLPRMCNSGRRSTDVPVFDLVLMTCLQAQTLFDDSVADGPWVVPATCTLDRTKTRLALGPSVVQAAKQVIVLETSHCRRQKQFSYLGSTNEVVGRQSLPGASWVKVSHV